MTFSVFCADCRLEVAVCRNATDAAEIRDRHNKLRGHDADVIRHLGTPFEGLL